MGIAKQIIGSFEDIGKDVVREAAQVPADVAGKALESLGTSGGQKQQGQTTVNSGNPEDSRNLQKGPWEEFDAIPDEKVKKTMARRALEALLARPIQKEPSVWERMQKEAEQRKQMTEQQQQQATAASIPAPTPKRPRGDLYGMKAKKLGSEVGKNVINQ
ncbi:hypothetical protein A3A64_04380 [Candidatus Gottesmanbacteria bacterium RIFCSPLOWO2_01_FULL_48_11]|uniref:Uncharacterized protein n=1 Tax=Candidatus Gottesmanbacteria bacterium RIFCSPLOWO2_01_FULL_48_11 TaxID=1798395 RepID=A0A1F6AUG3_9BACT|nr:MAG: hypothetical protein A3A64_04380 [Candidatus Gottesmanbacteria bacterium RIFCSPLOWO2_01_FULL_48_11]